MLVERLLVERRAASVRDHCRIRGLDTRVVLIDEQDLTAAELCLVEVEAVRVVSNQPVQGRQRLLRLSDRLVRARQLVQDLVGIRVVLIRFEQRRIQLHSFRVIGRGGLGAGVDFLILTGRQIEVAEPARRAFGILSDRGPAAPEEVATELAVGPDVARRALEELRTLRLVLQASDRYTAVTA